VAQHTAPPLQSVLSSHCSEAPVTHPGKLGVQYVGNGGKQLGHAQQKFEDTLQGEDAQLIQPGVDPPSAGSGVAFASSATRLSACTSRTLPSPPPDAS